MSTGVMQYAYNGLDALTQVTDLRSLTTAYTVDGLVCRGPRGARSADLEIT